MSGFEFQFGAALVGNLDEEIAAGRRRVNFAVLEAMREAGEGTRDRLRLDVGSALGARLARSWSGTLFPNSGLNAAYEVKSRAPLIVQAFENGEVIRSGRGAWLTIPNPDLRLVGRIRKRRRGQGRSIVAEYEARFGELRMVFLHGRRDLALLVTDMRRGRGKRGGMRKLTDGARARGDFEETVVFYLVPYAKMPRLLRGAEIRRRAERDFPAKFQRAFDRHLERAERSPVALTFRSKGSAVGSD